MYLHPDFKYMESRGLVLTEEGESLYWEYTMTHDGCTCFLGHPPCSSCTHEGNPHNLVETPEYWENELVAAIRDATKGTA